ncbi:MAG: hypothetical protein D6729_15530 [Deltaproteobacteria bacterium]|nr:MAG: hypothetical protein D6729_15530 [Deltaproteobacteria bacterium]
MTTQRRRLGLLLAVVAAAYLPLPALAAELRAAGRIDGRSAECRLAPASKPAQAVPVLDLPEGRHRLRIVCGTARDEARPAAVTVREVEVPAKGARLTVDLRLGRLQTWIEDEGRRIEGRIEVRPLDAPAEEPPLYRLLPSLVTRIPAGTYRLRAVPDDPGVPPWEVRVRVPAGGKVLRRGIDVSAGAARISIALPRGAAGSVFAHRPGEVDHVARAPAGTPLRLRPGVWDLRVVLEDAADRPTKWLRGRRIEPSRTLQASVRFPTGRLRVTVVGLADAEPPALHLLKPPAEDSFAIFDPGEEVLLSPGTYRLLVEAEDGRLRDAGQVRIVAGRTTRRRLDLRPAKLRVGLRDPLPQLASVAYVVEADTGSVVADERPLPAEFEVPAGRYVVHLRVPTRPPRALQQRVKVAFGETRRVTMELTLVPLRVEAPWAAQPARVAAFRAGSRAPAGQASLGELLYLEPGPYDLRVVDATGKTGWALGITLRRGPQETTVELAPPKH